MNARLVKYNKEKQILKKNVSAIHISAKLSLLQRKLVNALLYNAYDQLLTAKEHQISSTLLSEIIGFDSHNTAYLKAALKGLVETTIEFDILEDDGTRDWKVSSLISEAGIRNGVCSYAFSATMAEKLYHPDMYSKINLSVLREMKSAHALVLYENCHRYLGIAHTPWWDVDVFRKLMSVDQMTSYKQFKLLNRAVIQPAVKEVNELSNIQIELETKRKGRSVTGLRFLIRPNPQLSLIGMDTEDAVTETAAYKALLEEGISRALARAWVLEHDEDYIFDKLDLASDQSASGRIRSTKAGFLKAAIEEDYHNEKAAKKRRLESVQAVKAEREKLEHQLDALRTAQKEAETAFRWACAEIIEEAYQALPEAQREAVSAEFRLGLENHIYVGTFTRSGWKDRLNFDGIRKFWEARGLSLPSPADVARKSGSKAPDTIRTQIEKIEAQLEDGLNLNPTNDDEG